MNLLHMFISSMVLSVFLLAGCGQGSTTNADLDRVLDVTIATMADFENTFVGAISDTAMVKFVGQLTNNLNTSKPKVHPGPVGVRLEDDGSFLGYHDKNSDRKQDSGEKNLFTVEIDSEKQRILASNQEFVRDHSFSGMGTGLMAGMLVNNLMNRQRGSGVNPQTLSSKAATPRAIYQTARSRSGSGSHASGK